MEYWNIITLCIACLHAVTAQFLPPGSGSGCPPFFMCPLNCHNGYVLDSRGCRTCACAGSSGTGSTGGSGSFNPGGNPLHQGGAQMGGTGPGAGHVAISTSPDYTTPCIHGVICDIKCPFGFYNGESGCQFCLCAPDPDGNPDYTNPCSDAASTCDMKCDHGYQTGTDGCQYCTCVEMTTPGPTHPPTTVTTLSPQDQCYMKLLECQMQHKFGFMTLSDCEMCVGKDEIYRASNIPESRQPLVRLSNPCIQGHDVCMIFCNSGYRTGPRSCQFCACRE